MALSARYIQSLARVCYVFKSYVRKGITEEAVFLELAFVNFLLIINNLVPISSSDGYFIVASLLNKANIQHKYAEVIASFPGISAVKSLNQKEKMYIIIASICIIMLLSYHSILILSVLRLNTYFALLIIFSILYSAHVILVKQHYKSITPHRLKNGRDNENSL